MASIGRDKALFHLQPCCNPLLPPWLLCKAAGRMNNLPTPASLHTLLFPLIFFHTSLSSYHLPCFKLRGAEIPTFAGARFEAVPREHCLGGDLSLCHSALPKWMSYLCLRAFKQACCLSSKDCLCFTNLVASHKRFSRCSRTRTTDQGETRQH